MANNNTAIIIIGMVLIVALVMAGPISMGFSNFLDNLWDGWQDVLGQGSQDANAGLQLTIYYADGTSRTVKTSKGLVPLTISDGGREVTRVHLETFVTATFTGTVQAWEITGGTMQCNLKTITDEQIATMFDESWGPKSGSTWTSGEEKHMFDRDLGATLIEQKLQETGQPDGKYRLKFDTQFAKLAVMFDDGSTDERSPNLYTISWEFDYSTSGIESVYITVTSEPWF